jgi:uncharacterized NAD-dependent epimerase/dehydratase family protein
MSQQPTGQQRDGVAIVYCEGSFDNAYGKTAHGLIRFTRRYDVAAVIDSHLAGRDAGEVLDGTPNGIPIVADLTQGLAAGDAVGSPPTHLVIGLATDGGTIDEPGLAVVRAALDAGLNVDSGLHDFLSERADLAELAFANGGRIRDVRMPPPRAQLHFYSGKIREVDSIVVAVLGTDSAVGKRTTAWRLVESLEAQGTGAEMIGTGQTAWMQGSRYGILLDSLVNDFVAGELEHAVWSAWKETGADYLVVEGQGSLMHPAYPGGFEILAACRPDAVILQHAPARTAYDGFPDAPLHPVETQIEAIELISGRPVVAITLNHEGLDSDEVERWKQRLRESTDLPVFDVLLEGAEGLADAVGNAERFGRGA